MLALQGQVPRPLRPALALLAGAGTLLVGIELAVVISGPVEPAWVVSLFPISGAAYLTAGLVAWVRRPANRMAPLMMTGGGFLLTSGLVNTTVPVLIAAGLICQTLIISLGIHLLLSFPAGRLRGRADRALVAAGYFTGAVLEAPKYLFVPGPENPYTVLRLASEPGLFDAGRYTQRALGALIFALVIVVLVSRVRAAAPRQRVLLAPVYLLGFVVALGVPLTGTLLDGSIELAAVQLIAFGLVPIAFLVGVLLGGFARTAEVEELGRWLGSGGRGTVDAVAAALGDPSVELAHWSEPAGRYVDGAGLPVELPAVGSRRGAVEVDVEGRRIGAIVYDTTLNAEPETVRAAGQVVALALDRERLEREIASATDTARRSIAQDLHDGLQSRLVLLAVQADLDGNEQLRTSAQTAVGELRELVQGIMPSVLVERGLFRATETLAAGLPLPVALTLSGDADGLPDHVQSEAYFVIAEALTNAVKHSSARELSVLVERRGDRLAIEVADDGTGGAQPGGGAGLTGMAERARRLGGRLEVDSLPGTGTRIRVELPCG